MKTKKLLMLLLMLCTNIVSQAQNPCQANFAFTVLGNNTVQFVDSSLIPNNDSIVACFWDFGNLNSVNDTSSQPNPSYIYPASGNYTVCYSIVSGSGCVDTICININICNLSVWILQDTLQSNLTAIINGGTAPYTYIWSNGSTNLTQQNLVQGIYTVTVTDANGCTSSSTSFVSANSCAVYFSYTMYNTSNEIQFFASTGGDSIYWNMGDGTFYSDSFTFKHQYNTSGTYNVCAYSFNNGTACDTLCGTINYTEKNSMICGYIFIDTNGNGIMDNNEQGLQNQYVSFWGNQFQGSVITNGNGYYSALVPPGTVYKYIYIDSMYTVTFPAGPNTIKDTILIGNGDTLCGYNIAVQLNQVHIEGIVFGDTNADGVYNNGDWLVPNNPVMIGNNVFFTNNAGTYSAYVPIGTHTATYVAQTALLGMPLTTVGAHTVIAPTPGIYSGHNFGIDVPANAIDVEINLSGYILPRPGVFYSQVIQVKNVNFTSADFDLTMTYDSKINFSSASPAQLSHNSATHTITWSTGTLAPMQTSNFIIFFFVPTNVIAGTALSNTAQATVTNGTDVNTLNNTDILVQTVVNSCDPNNKLVLKTNFIDPAYQLISSLSADQEIKYCVNFQNTGTAEAINIVVVDSLDSNLDATSYQFLGASHNCVVTQTGNEVVYKFPNIWLPDSTTNEPLSHGYVLYKINAKNNLMAGTVLSDNADIYFDFNAAVITNNTNILLATTLNSYNVHAGASTMQVLPNPGNGHGQLLINSVSHEEVQLSIVNVQGKKVHSSKYTLHEGVNSMALPVINVNGIYEIIICNQKGAYSTRWVVK